MSELMKILAQMDNMRRRVARNVREMVADPDQYAEMVADRLPETAQKMASDPSNFIPGGGLLGSTKRMTPTAVFGREIIPEAMMAQNRLTGAARDFNNNWNVNWHKNQDTFVESDVAKQLSEVFEPVREKMKRVYGDSVPLYRGEGSGESINRRLFSWTPDKELAEKFAVNRTHGVPDPVSDDVVKKAIENYQTRGYASLGRNHYIRSRIDPKYYNIYEKSNNQFVTDGDDFVKEALSFQKDRQDFIESLKKKGALYRDDIPVDQTFWIPTGLNIREPEVITRIDPRPRGLLDLFK